MYKVFALYTIFTISALTFIGVGLCHAQTYTFTKSNTGCDGQWGTEECWEVTILDATNCSTYSLPPINLSSSSCESNIIINGDVTYDGNMTLGGGFSSLTISDNTTFSITGNLTFENDANVDISLEGRNSAFDIGLTLTINASDTVNVIGPSDLLESEEITSFVTARDLYVRGKSMLSIDEHAGMDITGTTDAHTPSNDSADRATIDVDGIFYSTSVKIRGNSHLAFVVTEDAEVRASESTGTLEMNGNSTLTFIGDVYEGGDADGASYIDVGGVIDTNGSGAKITADDATLFTCNTFPTDITKVEQNNGKFEEGTCRILPVTWLNFTAEFDPQGQPKIRWATAKEWENSHFIIERAVNGIAEFKPVGEVNAIGWTDTITEYSFNDPISFPVSSTLYYRLKQINLDGTYEYSKVISLQGNNTKSIGWTAYPNPINNNSLSVYQTAKQFNKGDKITVKLYSPGGFSQIASQLFDASHLLNLDELINKAPKGLLILEIIQANQVERLKVLNQ